MGSSVTSETGVPVRLVARGADPADAKHSRLVPRCFHSTLSAAAGVGARPAATGDPAASCDARSSLSAMHGPTQKGKVRTGEEIDPAAG